MKVIQTTRQEMEIITAELRIKAALKAKLPPATLFDFQPGQKVRVYLEGSKRWEGSFSISRMDGKQIWMTDGKKCKQFACTQILPDTPDIADRELSRFLKGLQHFNSG